VNRFSRLLSSPVGQSISGSFALLGLRVGGMAAALVATTLLARTLAPADFALIAGCISIATLGSLVATVNLGAPALRFVPRYRQQARHAAAAGYLFTLRCVSAFIMLFSLVMAALLAADIVAMADGLRSTLIAGCLSLPLFALMRTEAAFLHSLGHVLRASLGLMLIRPLVFTVAVIVLVYFTQAPLSVHSALLAFLGAAGLAALIQIRVSHATVKSEGIVGARDLTERADWFKSAFALLTPTVLLECAVDITVLSATLVIDAEQVAAVAVLMRLQGILLFGVSSVSMAFGPRIAKAHASGDVSLRDRLIRTSTHLKLWPSIGLLMILWVFSDLVLGVFGEHYVQYQQALLVVASLPLVLALAGPTVLLATVLQLEAAARWIFASALLALVSLIGIGGHLFGVTGVACAVLCVWVFWNFSLSRLIWQRTGIDSSVLSLLRRQ